MPLRIKAVLKLVLIFFTSIFSQYAYSLPDTAILEVMTPTSSTTFTRTMLLTFPVYHININNSRAYLNRPMSYQAIKLCDILKPYHLSATDTVELISSDNFSAILPASVITNCSNKTAIGFIAIEPEHKPWPQLKYNNPDKNHPDDGTAGPLAVIWVHPEKSYISNEYWAWKLVKIKIHHQLVENMYLRAPNTKNKRILNGYHAYISRCAGCHTINKIGNAVIGPDLNTPKNPTEYFESDAQFKKFIRDPQSVRVKANDRMSGTNEEFLSNKDLDDLIIYLKYMTKHRE